MAFIANGAVLARRSGISQLPMDDAVKFESPKSLKRTVYLPHAGGVTGMAIEPGVTVIVGGGYHGKSTVLSAIQRGVYAHVPGDGRELVAALPEAMKIRAADGRPVTKVDVSPFINHLSRARKAPRVRGISYERSEYFTGRRPISLRRRRSIGPHNTRGTPRISHRAQAGRVKRRACEVFHCTTGARSGACGVFV